MRITLFKEARVPCVYTLEASFFGPHVKEYADMQFTEEMLEDMGRNLLQGLYQYGNYEKEELEEQINS